MRERGSKSRVIKPVTSFAIVVPGIKKKLKSHLQSYGFEPVYDNRILFTSFIVQYNITVAIQDKHCVNNNRQTGIILSKWN